VSTASVRPPTVVLIGAAVLVIITLAAVSLVLAPDTSA
jgi:hypothetical protein